MKRTIRIALVGLIIASGLIAGAPSAMAAGEKGDATSTTNPQQKP